MLQQVADNANDPQHQIEKYIQHRGIVKNAFSLLHPILRHPIRATLILLLGAF